MHQLRLSQPGTGNIERGKWERKRWLHDRCQPWAVTTRTDKNSRANDRWTWRL